MRKRLFLIGFSIVCLSCIISFCFCYIFSPKLYLNGGNIELKQNDSYTEYGYKSYFMGLDITDDVQVKGNVKEEKIGTYILTYRVKYFIFEVTKKRKVTILDTESPVMELNGNDVIYLNLNSEYQEYGVNVSDNSLEDLSDRVNITSDVDTNKVGEYSVIYTVSDASGNISKVTRTVKVVDDVDNFKGVIYLTFDDGPTEGITDKILDILKEENVKATFFVINKSDKYNYLIKREDDEGHTVGLHSYSHNYKSIYTSVDNFFDDLDKIGKKVESITGSKANIIRFPGGSSNTVSKKYCEGIMSDLVEEVKDRGYIYFDWNISSGDAGEVSTSEEVYNNVVNNLSYDRINVVLMHDGDGKDYTVDALMDIIEFGKENGYVFSNITSDTLQVKHNVYN